MEDDCFLLEMFICMQFTLTKSSNFYVACDIILKLIE